MDFLVYLQPDTKLYHNYEKENIIHGHAVDVNVDTFGTGYKLCFNR